MIMGYSNWNHSDVNNNSTNDNDDADGDDNGDDDGDDDLDSASALKADTDLIFPASCPGFPEPP